jgi:uncharacterized repeat protein (TIGR03803 family)
MSYYHKQEARHVRRLRFPDRRGLSDVCILLMQDLYGGLIARLCGNCPAVSDIMLILNRGFINMRSILLSILLTLNLAAQSTETVLHSFAGGPIRGEYPDIGVILGSNGVLYGMSTQGGTNFLGVVYKLDGAGHQTALHSFLGGSDGAYPYGGLIRDTAGNLYGTTQEGGTANQGTVFKIDSTGNESALYTFTGSPDGGSPTAPVVMDAEGNLYGTAALGGTAGQGVVFKLDRTGHETVLYNFLGGNDGAQPETTVTLDPAGNLYGTTSAGGVENAGIVYKLDAAGHETVLFNLSQLGLSFPSGLVRDAAGNLYGSAVGGVGAIFKVAANGQTSVLYSFKGGSDGAGPVGLDLALDRMGNLYGTTGNGGAYAEGTIFKVAPSGKETRLYNFTGGTDGWYPVAGVVRDSSGNLYGTAQGGGAENMGVVFKLDTTGTQTTLCSFNGGVDGANPVAGLIRDSSGNFYGTANYGGAANYGMVYALTPQGRETVLYTFQGQPDAAYPEGPLVRDASGNLYGGSYSGGTGCGAIFKLDATGHESLLHDFGWTDGCNPVGALVHDPSGNLYGVTETGGFGYGQFSSLYSFTSFADGTGPNGVVRDSSGNLFGTTGGGGAYGWGTVFKLSDPNVKTVLYNFTGKADGLAPSSNLTLDSTGNMYGTTGQGGASGFGVVFEVTPAGSESVIYSFQGGSDGAGPLGDLIRNSAGTLYGITNSGGASNAGTVYQIDSSRKETVIYSFTGQSDGGFPRGGLIRDSAGNLYGTTFYGGQYNAGVVYKIKP